MGRLLADSYPAVRQLYDRAGELLGYDLARVCFEGPAAELDSTVHSQPALFVTSLAAVEQLRADRPQLLENCQAVAGLSLGEYTALVFAGAIDFESGLRVVQRRGQAMQQASDAVPSGMISVLGLETERVTSLCVQCCAPGEVLQVANYLCPGNIAVSGSRDACQRLAQAALAAGAMKVIPLQVAGAFHTPLMGPAVDQLAEALANVTLVRPRIPVYSNVDARPHEDPDEIRQLLVQQVVQPVLWEDSMRRMLEDGLGDFHEVGPGRVLRGLLRRIDRRVTCECVPA